jgi:DNA polymerase-3 subunit gamma/tau
MDGLIEHFRNIMTVVLTKDSNLVESADIYKSRYLDYTDKFSEGDLLRLLNFLNKTQQELRYSQNQKLKIEISLSHLIGLERSSTISELINKIGDAEFNISDSSNNNETRTVKSQPIYTQKSSAAASTKQNIVSQKTNRNSYQARNILNNSSDIESPQFSFESVVKKWAAFVESVNSEKGLMFGPFIKSVKLLNLEGNEINIYSEDSHGKDIISRNQDYLAQKSQEYFGKKLKFCLKDSAKIDPNIMQNTQVEDNSETNLHEDDDPYINAIINELGGEEVR